jgi:squalene-hopene/tetraprenyl-beta-curcumene cyclase
MQRILLGLSAPLLLCLPTAALPQQPERGNQAHSAEAAAAKGLGTLLPAPQGAAAPVKRKVGAIYKDEVDQLIGLLRDTARRSEAGAAAAGVLGDSAVTTAQILVAMGHCHRRYHVSDGPVVRPSIDYLLKCRRADGSFGDAATTYWVAEALAVMDPDAFRAEITAARAIAKAAGVTGENGFDALVATVLGDVRADRVPQQMAADAAGVTAAFAKDPAALDRSVAAEALLQLVACQAANRQLDQREQGSVEAAAAWSPAQEKAFQWLLTQQENGIFLVPVPMRGEDGKTQIRRIPDPALTGFGLLALQTKPKPKRTQQEQAIVDRGLKWLVEGQNEDGTFGERVPNYTTCVVVAAITRAGDPTHAPVLQKAQRAILAFQNSESQGYQRSDRDYGSIGYGNSQRGDLSNLHFSLEALRATGLPAEHEAFKKALVFLQRTQNLKSVNDFSGKVPDPDREGVILDATSGDDGGAAYYPGNSAAGYVVQPDGKSVPRSYGSMTYALLKSYTLAGLPGDDPRVVAAVQWIQDNWTLAVNPGADPALGEKVQYQGLFYYYMVLAQALELAKVQTVRVPSAPATGGETEPATREVDWRQALRSHLESIQQPDGTWVNGKNDRWMEGLPLLCTCYALTALELCR